MSDVSDFLTKWVRKNITPTTAHIRNDTLTAGRLAEECLWEAQGQNLSEDEVIDAAGSSSPGDLEPVFDAILKNATEICEAKFGQIFSYDDGLIQKVAHVNDPPALAAWDDRIRRRGLRVVVGRPQF